MLATKLFLSHLVSPVVIINNTGCSIEFGFYTAIGLFYDAASKQQAHLLWKQQPTKIAPYSPNFLAILITINTIHGPFYAPCVSIKYNLKV